jgi:hypothetical protein
MGLRPTYGDEEMSTVSQPSRDRQGAVPSAFR